MTSIWAENEDGLETTNRENELIPDIIIEWRGKIKFIFEKLVAVLDRCQLSERDVVFVIELVAEALGYNINDFVINWSSIHKWRKILRINISERAKTKFCGNLPNFAVVH